MYWLPASRVGSSEALLLTQHDGAVPEVRTVDSRTLLILSAAFLVACGGFAIFQAATGHFLPHDTAYLGMTASQLCALNSCRILHFMIHDRISFGGVLVAIGVLYLWLARFPLRRQESWAWWALALSGFAGFLSFLAYLGYGYLDTWHGAATLVLLPIFVAGLVRTRGLRRERVEPERLDLHSGPGVGRVLLLLSSVGICAAGLTIMTVGMTSVFVPQDLAFMGTTRSVINAINPHLVPLIAHDRAGFGGALVSFGVAMFACVWYARPLRALRQALTMAGIAGFGTAVGVHPAIGYMSASHLGPAVLGCIVFAVGLALAAQNSRAYSDPRISACSARSAVIVRWTIGPLLTCNSGMMILLLASVPRAFAFCPLAFVVLVGCSERPSQPTPSQKAPLYNNLGTHHHAISTSSPEAQKYFDQGFTLSYAFNHAEAIRAFRQASALDPSCAMCSWGVAFALGPNINAPITEDAAKQAFQAIEDARARGGSVSENERAYIDALAKRYSANPKAERAPLDAAYAAAMRDVVRRFPDDLDAATLFAQSLMDTSPWNYWNLDGTPRTFTNEVLASLESVLERKADHLGAIHLYIHAVEASPDPRRAEQFADKLPALAPGAGHLVHMPAHIYLRVGRYEEASTANQRAIKADEAYFAGDAVAGNMMYQVGYLPHNFHFFVTSASMEGRRADALKAANEVRARMPAEMLRDPSMAGMVQHMQLTPLFAKIRFGMWTEVLAEPAPPDDLRYMSAMWHVARGLAHAAEHRPQDARKELAAVAALKDDASLKTLYVSNVNAASSIVAIAHEILAGELAATERRRDEAIRHFAAAVTLEDGLTYMEPPDWPIPARELQGAALLALGRAKEAEAAFREDLRKFPDNGWSLSGLLASLTRQRRTAEAADVKGRLDDKWRRADTEVLAARPN